MSAPEKRMWRVIAAHLPPRFEVEAFDFEVSDSGVSFYTEVDAAGEPLRADVFVSHPVTVVAGDL